MLLLKKNVIGDFEQFKIDVHLHILIIQMSKILPHFRDFNIWEKINEDEIDRLQGTLYPHLKKIGIKKTKGERVEFVKQILKKQNNTCIWGKERNGKYCWNEPKYNWKKNENGIKQVCICPILKFQWGHLMPRSRKEKFGINTLCLMCGRCNNHIQSSRKPEQLLPELLSKVSEIIDQPGMILQEENINEIKKALMELNLKLKCLETRRSTCPSPAAVIV
jgi:hypothetical protein